VQLPRYAPERTAKQKGKTVAEKKHELHHLEIHPAKNGGHTVHHHFMPKPASRSGAFMGPEEPEHHVFGPEEGHEMLAHVAHHLGIKPVAEREEDEEPEESEELEEEPA
jgi:hypothetical protein